MLHVAFHPAEQGLDVLCEPCRAVPAIHSAELGARAADLLVELRLARR